MNSIVVVQDRKLAANGKRIRSGTRGYGQKRIPGARVVEGEAPETDDELNVDHPSTSATLHVEELPKVTTIPQRARAHIDERLEQRWRKLGENALTVSTRRTRAAMKMVNDLEDSIDNTIASVQSAAAYIRYTSTVVYHLEDSVEAILDAAKLIPARYENTVRVTRLK